MNPRLVTSCHLLTVAAAPAANQPQFGQAWSRNMVSPDVGLPVARVVVPGLRHFWARFGPGRLYDVPVALGWRAAPLLEEQLNDFAVYF